MFVQMFLMQKTRYVGLGGVFTHFVYKRARFSS